MTDLRTVIKNADPAPGPAVLEDAQVRALTRRITAGDSSTSSVSRWCPRLRSRASIAAALGVALVGGGAAVASLGPAEDVATSHLLAPPYIVSGVGPQSVAVPDAPDGARYIAFELACFDSSTCGTPAGSVSGGPLDQVKVDRGFLPTTNAADPSNPQQLEPLATDGLPLSVDEGAHWRLYAVYTDKYEFDTARLSNGKTLGIPGITPADYLPAVTTDGKDGWISYNDLTFDASVTLTSTGVHQDPLPVYAADGVTKIGITDINATITP